MLNRLADLRSSTGQRARPADEVGEDGDAGDQEGEYEEELEDEQELDDEEKAFMEDMQERFQEMLEDEGAAKQAFTEVRNRVDNMHNFVKEAQTALLPSKIATLQSKFESEEIICQRMIRRAKETLAELRAEDEDYEEDEVAALALWPVRQSLAKARGKEFKMLVQGFFNARSHSKQEMLKRAYRQLKFAYPDALDEELRDILEFPEVAIDAINQRLEKGAEANSLEHILEELEGKKGDSKKLEQGARELKLMFLQFSELIDTQGEALDSIEANIQSVITETSEAIGTLQEAEQAKRLYQGQMLKGSICCIILLFVFAIYPMWKYCMGEAQSKSWYEEIAGDTSLMFGGLFYLKNKITGGSQTGKDNETKDEDGDEKEDEDADEDEGKHDHHKRHKDHHKHKSSLFQMGVQSISILRNDTSIAQTAAVTLGHHTAPRRTHTAAAPKVPLQSKPPALPEQPQEALQMLQGPLRRLVAMSSKGNMDARQRSALRHRAKGAENDTIRWRTIER